MQTTPTPVNLFPNSQTTSQDAALEGQGELLKTPKPGENLIPVWAVGRTWHAAVDFGIGGALHIVFPSW